MEICPAKGVSEGKLFSGTQAEHHCFQEGDEAPSFKVDFLLWFWLIANLGLRQY